MNLPETYGFPRKISKLENQLADLVLYKANMIFMDYTDPPTLLMKPKKHPIFPSLCCAEFFDSFFPLKILNNNSIMREINLD